MKAINIITKHGKDDFSICTVDFPQEALELLSNTGGSVRGTLAQVISDLQECEDERPWEI